MSDRDSVIAKARSQVGYQRKPSRWNVYARDVYPTVQSQAYCGVFAAWVIIMATGADVRKVCWMPFVPSIESWARKNGAWKTSGQKDGDLVVFGFGKSSAQHVGFAWRDENAKTYRSIEGNTSPGNAGSQGNGGGVHVRYRSRSQIRGWVDLDKLLAAAGRKPSVSTGGASVPAAKPKPAPAKPAVAKPAATKAPAFPLPRKKGAMYYYGPENGPRTSVSGMGRNTAVPHDVVQVGGRWKSKGLAEFQARLIARGWSELKKDGADGRYGATTYKVVRQFQKSMGLPVDGKIGPGTWAAAWTEPVK